MNNQGGSTGITECAAESTLETESPEITVFDVAQIRVQRYVTNGGDGMLILRVDDASGAAQVCLSFFGFTTSTGQREIPQIQVSTFDERTASAS